MSMQDPLDILDVIEDHLDDDGDNEPEHLFMNGDVYQGSLPPPPHAARRNARGSAHT